MPNKSLQTIVSASMEICIWQLSPAQPSWQLQQLWHNDYRLNFTDNTIHATDTAWQLLNVSNGTQTMSIDDYANFKLDTNK
jgi:hypothetical protein